MLLSLQGTFPPAILALADGTVFIGNSIGATGSTVGEVVFNTSLTGYQEILTDPSYCQQIVTLTYPHIGNYGVNGEDIEADKVHAAGLIIRDLPLVASNFRSTATLSEYLVREGTVAIADIDTRKLTRLLRTTGAQNGCIVGLPAGEQATQARIDEAVAAAKAAPSMSGLDLAQVIPVFVGPIGDHVALFGDIGARPREGDLRGGLIDGEADRAVGRAQRAGGIDSVEPPGGERLAEFDPVPDPGIPDARLLLGEHGRSPDDQPPARRPQEAADGVAARAHTPGLGR